MNLVERSRIVAARAEPRFRLWLRFADDSEGEVDVGHLVGAGVFEAWRDAAVWAAVRVDVDAGTVVWPGDIDLDPIALYCQVTGAALPGSAERPMRAAS